MKDIEFSNFTITKREMFASIAIIALMIMFGFLISTKWSESQQESDIKYNKAIQINEDTELFQYGIDTNIGNAFVYGDYKAVDPVSYPDIDGEYMYIRKEKEKYTMHTRTVTTTDSKGHTSTKVETYWSWDYAGEESKECKNVIFCGIEFPSDKIPFPDDYYIDTVSGGYHVRYVYYGTPAVNKGTIFTKLGNGTIDNTDYYDEANLEEDYKRATSHFPMWLFWILWLLFTGIVVFGFYYLDNKWLE